ncbi:MAG TPA: hypothetical protein VI197_05675 [Polyangiaceae bacterium]
MVEQHPAIDAFDCNPRTAWAEDVAEGTEQGEYLEARFASAVPVNRLVMATGYSAVSSKHGDLFVKNLHLKTVQVLVNGTPIADEPFHIASSERWFDVQISNRSVETVRLEFLETYPTTQWSDLHVSEVLLFGPTSGKSECATCDGLVR